jgi:hypothetical protein
MVLSSNCSTTIPSRPGHFDGLALADAAVNAAISVSRNKMANIERKTVRVKLEQ